MSSLSQLKFAINMETDPELIPNTKKNKIVIMKALKITWLQFVQGKSCRMCLEFNTFLSPHSDWADVPDGIWLLCLMPKSCNSGAASGYSKSRQGNYFNFDWSEFSIYVNFVKL